MATYFEKAFGEYDKRTTGNINSWKIRTVPHGAKVIEEIDNFTLGELGFDEHGQRTVKSLTSVDKKGYLVATPERRYMDEPIDSFYNAVGEFARIVHLDAGVRFDTSAFEADESLSDGIKNGLFAHFNPATKKFVIHDGQHEDYANATDKFLVVNNEEDLEYTLGAPLVRLEVQ